MSSPMKLSLLALVSSVAAIPHYGHSRFHQPSGGYGTGSSSGRPAYPTGGWSGSKNTTAVPYPTGTAVVDDKTTTILETLYSTATVVETVYASKPAGSSVGAVDVSTGAAACGETVYVTATNKVTVTVPAGGAGAPSSSAEALSSAAEAVSSVIASSAPVYEEAPPASSAVEEKISFPQKPVNQPAPTPAPTSEGIYSILPVTSEAAPAPSSEAAPVSSKVESATPIASETVNPTGSPAYNGGKRGLAYNDVQLTSKFGEGKFSWAYNWAEAENGNLPQGINFVPLCHRPDLYQGDGSSKWFNAVDEAAKKGSTVVMGFNEPDHAEQANLSPSGACSEWKRLMNPVASSHPDLTILGPSVTNGGGEMGLTWLKNFADACPDAVWHAANIHFYDIFDDNTVERFKAQVQKAAEQTGKKVWVTEFGLNPGSANEEQTKTFLKGVMEFMDGSDLVQGYSYFMVGTGAMQLNNADGLSGIGEVYASG